LNICHDYSVENGYTYNVTKCAVIYHNPFADSVLLLGKHRIPVIRSGKLLGIVIQHAKFAPAESIKSRITGAESALNALSCMGILQSSSISLFKRQLAVKSWVFAKYEYGLSFLKVKLPELKPIMELQRKSAARLFCCKRGTLPMMRAAGLIPIHHRYSYLQTKFVHKLQTINNLSVAAKVFDKVRNKRYSMAHWFESQSCIQSCNKQFEFNQTIPMEQRQSFNDIINIRMSNSVWNEKDARKSKLTAIQAQGWNQVHILGFIAGANSDALLRWVVGLSPSMIPNPCRNCNGRYNLNRWHILRCTPLLYQIHLIIKLKMYIDFSLSIPNPMDFILNVQSLDGSIEDVERICSHLGPLLRSSVLQCLPEEGIG
jgi:hypothetical protein